MRLRKEMVILEEDDISSLAIFGKEVLSFKPLPMELLIGQQFGQFYLVPFALGLHLKDLSLPVLHHLSLLMLQHQLPAPNHYT